MYFYHVTEFMVERWTAKGWKTVLLMLASIGPFWAHAQSSDLGSWNLINVRYNYNTRLSAFAEGQVRSLRFYDDFHYHEYKGGINYKLEKNVVLTAAAGNYQTYSEGGDFLSPRKNNEIRLWPQIALQQTVGRLRIEQRYRAELRFTSDGYRNRFRYRVGLAYPFGKEKNDFKPFQIGVSNELFFTNKELYFERNRMQLAMNYKPCKAIALQLGYLHQFDYKINDETGRDFLVVGFFYEIDREKAVSKE